MNELVEFFSKFGLQLTLFAILGIASLGVMKYCNLFAKLEEKTRHLAYIGISVGFSILSTSIYLLCIKQFDVTNMFAFGSAVYALNQAWYSIFKTTSLNDLIANILTKLVDLLKSKK